jgi:hypothetical protein
MRPALSSQPASSNQERQGGPRNLFQPSQRTGAEGSLDLSLLFIIIVISLRVMICQ